MGLRSLFTRHRTPEPAAPSPAPAAATPPAEPVEQAPLTGGQRADLEAAQAEFLQAASEAGVNQLHACGRDGSRWQEDPQALRAISAILRDLQHENKRT